MFILKKIIITILIASSVYACTADNTVEEQVNNQKVKVIGTGDDGTTTPETGKAGG